MKKSERHIFLFDGHGHLSEEGTAHYAEMMLQGRQGEIPAELLRHVDVCQVCKQACLDLIVILEQEGVLPEGMLDEGSPPLPAGGSERPEKGNAGRGWWRVAAAAAILTGLGVLMMMWLMRKEVTEKAPPQAVMTDTLDSRALTERIVKRVTGRWAAAFPEAEGRYEPDAAMEDMLALVFRSAEFIVTAPEEMEGITQGDTILFSWQGLRNQELILRISDNRGGLVHQRKLKHRDAYQYTRLLEPGLYYWVIEHRNTRVGGGRFGILPDQ